MPGLHELINPDTRHAGPVEGVIAAAPATVNDPVFVYVLGFDDRETKIGPCAWTPRGAAKPATNDPCAVAFTDAGTAVVVGWWPGGWPT